jgi:hypothetical protein
MFDSNSVPKSHMNSPSEADTLTFIETLIDDPLLWEEAFPLIEAMDTELGTHLVSDRPSEDDLWEAFQLLRERRRIARRIFERLSQCTKPTNEEVGLRGVGVCLMSFVDNPKLRAIIKPGSDGDDTLRRAINDLF